MAITFLTPDANKALVSAPGPGPISKTVELIKLPLRLAIFRVKFRSNKKF